MKRLIIIIFCGSVLCGQTIIRRRQMPAPGTLAAPTFDNGTNTYTNDVAVTITHPGISTACYTVGDGSSTPDATTPGTCSTGTTYSTAVSITATATVLKALSTQAGQLNSSVTSATYTLQGATPTASPAAGTVSAGTTVTWSSTTTGTVTFHYRTDGVDPTCLTGTTGSSVTVSSSTTYKVVACKASYVASPVLTAAFTASGATVTLLQYKHGTGTNGTTAWTATLASAMASNQQVVIVSTACGDVSCGGLVSPIAVTAPAGAVAAPGSPFLVQNNSLQINVWVVPSAAVTNTVTLTYGANAWYVSMEVSTWTGLATTSMFDQIGAAAFEPANTTVSISTSADTTNATDVIIGSVALFDAEAVTLGAGFGLIGQEVNGDQSEYKLVSATGPQACTWSFGATTGPSSAVCFAIKTQ